jgi:hypothetical protein
MNVRATSLTNADNKYHYGVPGHPLTSRELTELLERFPLERTGGRTLEEMTEAQLQLLMARIAALTDMLRGAEPNDAAHLASRMLLGDLATVAAQFRGRANGTRSSLAKALADLRDVSHGAADSDRH